jgi:hypothetical protein
MIDVIAKEKCLPAPLYFLAKDKLITLLNIISLSSEGS